MNKNFMKLFTLFSVFQAVIFFPANSLATEPFEFISAVVSSIERCKIADSRMETNKSQTGDLLERMRDIAVFTSDIRLAKSLVEPHTRSQNKLIGESAKTFSQIYSGIVANNEEALSLLEDALNNPKTFSNQQGTIMRKFSENMARNDQLRRALTDATVLSTYTLVDTKRTVSGKLAYLTITSAERSRLQSNLRRVFGDNVTQGAKAGQFALDVSGGLLWEFLAKPFKAADNYQ